MRAALFTIAAVSGLTACAPTADMPDGVSPRPCFRPNEVVHFTDDRATTVYFRTRNGAVFEASAAGLCDTAGAVGLALSPATGVSERICVGDLTTARVSLGRSTPPCRLLIARTLTEAEVAALPARSRP